MISDPGCASIIKKTNPREQLRGVQVKKIFHFCVGQALRGSVKKKCKNRLLMTYACVTHVKRNYGM